MVIITHPLRFISPMFSLENTKVDVGARSNLLASIEEGVLLKRVTGMEQAICKSLLIYKTDADKIPKGEGVIRKPKKPKNPNKPPKPPAAPGAPPPPPKPPIGKPNKVRQK